MRTHALLSVLALSALLAAPPPAGAADRHPSSRGGRADYRSSQDRGEGHRAPQYRRDTRRSDHRSYRRAPSYRYSPRYRYDAPRYRHYRPRYRYYGPGYAYGPYYGVPYYRTYPRAYAVPPYSVYPYAYAPVPYRGGVHGGVSLGFPGFGFSLYF